MEFYKKIFRSKKIRFGIISLFRFVPDKPMIRFQYRFKCGRRLNLKNPQRYTEKLQWYKLYYRNPMMVRCCDKNLVRSYVAEKGLSHILNEQYAVFDNPESISFDSLPLSFVLKLSNGSGTNLVVRNKNDVDRDDTVKRFKTFIRQTKARAGREWCYHVEKPTIVAEKFLIDDTQPGGVVSDYKILCFSGEPTYIICVSGRYTAQCNHLVYTPDWEKVEVDFEGSDYREAAVPPANLREMLDIAKILSAGFPAVRIDLYSIGGKEIVFGEMTFFPWSGYMKFKPDSFDIELGSKFILPN